jgi:predicted membrane protein
MPLLQIVGALVAIALVAILANTRAAIPAGIRLMANIVLALVVVGITLWLINSYVPMAASIKAILNIVVVVATCVGVLKATGLWDQLVSMWDRFKYRDSH